MASKRVYQLIITFNAIYQVSIMASYDLNGDYLNSYFSFAGLSLSSLALCCGVLKQTVRL